MVTDKDHIEALRNRLLDKLRANEQEHQELQEMIRVLGEAPRVLEGKPGGRIERQERVTEKAASATRYNLTFAKDIEDYIASYPWDEAININQMLDTLKREKGLKGKDKSLYAYAHQVLRKKVEAHQQGLHYQKGVGYYRTRKDDKGDSTLVASV